LKLVTFLVPEAYLEGLDRLVELGRFHSRSEAVRFAVREMIKRELWRIRAEKAMHEKALAKIRI
jgi:Arc/MetJ-type ribon-helix-helix transcriptional regulator